MSGHLFVVHGDLRTLRCDHWLFPVDAGLSASRSWNRTATWERIRDHLPARLTLADRVAEVPWEGERRPWPTHVASGSKVEETWQAVSARQFLERAHAAGPTLADRDRPLLALPVVGTGFGGKRRRAGAVLRALVPELFDFVAHHDADVALVTWTEEDFAAAQAARRAARQDTGVDPWAELRSELQAEARTLARQAARDRLVVFLGAGVSAGAGLPTWAELLDRLAVEAGFTAAEREGLARLGHLDRAQLLALRLGSDPAALGRAVSRCLDVGDTTALSHALLAGLPVREFITTNYDDCFERACDAVNNPVARLPYAPASGSRRWLLKMHGCVSAPQDIVLTRRDYVRYAERNAALAGIVQAMLITRHMLFVGFSLDDDNFHRIVDAVRRALVGADRDRLGSAVSLFPNPLVEQLWSDDLDWFHLAEDGGSTVAAEARRFEIFLDCVSAHATAPHHLLDPRFTAVLTPRERALAEALRPLRAWLASEPRPDEDDPAATAWAMIDDLLDALGNPPP
ncbi:MAG: SIR2 family protein [Myxococcales bacterium]|nr:SIR2 family protein [Myxococcales bacterium]